MSPLNTWRTLIVDDDANCRSDLRSLLQRHSGVEVVGEAASLHEAAALYEELKPDLVFLDVQLRGTPSFELLPMLSSLPGIIFVTSQEEFAIQAIELGAVDYLLKPVDPDRLGLTLSRLRGRVPDAQVTPAPRPLYMVDIMVVPVHRSYRVIPTTHIVSIKADANYSILTLCDGREVYVYRALNQWEAHLPPGVFLRLDRSLIIAPAHITDLQVRRRESALLALTGLKEPLQIGRTALSRLRDYLDAVDLIRLPKRISI